MVISYMPKRKRQVKRRRKARMKRYRSLSMNVYKFRMVLEAPLLTTDDPFAQGNVQANIACNSLSNHFITQPNGTSPPYPLLEQKDLSNLFDQYRVQGIRITYTPHSTEYSFKVDENLPIVGPVSGDQHQPLYIAYDVDNNGFIAADTLITRKHTKVKPLYKPWKAVFRLPKTYAPNQTSLFGGWRNLQSEANNNTGTISMSTAEPIQYYDDQSSSYKPIGLSQPIGRIMIETYVLFRKRQ